MTVLVRYLPITALGLCYKIYDTSQEVHYITVTLQFKVINMTG